MNEVLTNDVLNLKELVKEGRLFLDHADEDKLMAYIPTPFKDNHASNLIALRNGDLLCVWFAGLNEGANDIKVAMSRLKKGKNRWSEAELLSDDYTRSEQNPQLFETPDGKLWMFHTSQQSRGNVTEDAWKAMVARGEAEGNYILQHTAIVRRRISEDNGYTWGPSEVMFDAPGTFSRQPIVVLSNGDWLMPIWYSIFDGETEWGSDYSVVKLSTDQGKSWSEIEVPNSPKRVHMNIIETNEPGRCLAFYRSRSADRIYKSVSTDYGRTWSEPLPTILPNNNSSVQAIKLQSGAIAMVYNHLHVQDEPGVVLWPRSRFPVSIALTEDEGKTWPYIRHIDQGDGFFGDLNRMRNKRYEYPSVIQTEDGNLHITYSYKGRQCIKYVQVTEAWVKGC